MRSRPHRRAPRAPEYLHIKCALCIVFFALALPATATTNFDSCMADIRNGKWGTVGGTDNYGNPVDDIQNATAITYDLCLRACGSGPEAFSWSDFSEQFSAWLLPYLALVSQLPFGAKNRLGNLTSVILTVGSPALAGYSLCLTVLNGRWITRRFQHLSYPNADKAVRILSNLQQSPLRITSDDTLLSSLIVLHQNDEWWAELKEALDYTHTWSIAAATQIAWVVIAYVLTVIDSLSNMANNVNSNGQGVGSVWLWLLPIVIGWLQLSPKCDYDRLRKAFDKTKSLAFVATANGAVKASDLSEERAFSIDGHPPGLVPDSHRRSSITRDEELSAPIFNYARFLPWVQAVEDVATVFRVASRNANDHLSVDPNVPWNLDRDGEVDASNRSGTEEQVLVYTRPPRYARRSRWGPGVYKRVVVASLFALMLQWGTTGAAVVVVWFTPTTGLGCRSGAYLFYGALSTFVWFLMVTSSALAHYAYPRSHRLRRLGKVLAAFNAIWIVLACLFQFSNFFDRCYCNSSVLGRGSRAYDVITDTEADLAGMRSAWIAGVLMALGCGTVFIGFVKLFLDPSEEKFYA
ncbi:hypothetical protein JAAARDRAFT_251628 [Jaapia argillacea MUCL 33604]|uniref:MARVEL domain-containing protein n=1 Tax=Jaapia argillacea MUCL 33604 TaxID=933084 RepID=A0A067PT75_9AGAM|nr:hypothetical protein JAAARDRAFT_251628 [Jaapia argillacea MUCL 33604]